MKKATAQNNGGTAPPVLRFTAKLVRHPSSADSGAALNVPRAVAIKLRDLDKVEGTINGHMFRAPLERGQDGRRALRVNEAMLRGARTKFGDTVRLAVLGPEPKLAIPADLHTAMSASREAQTVWKELTDLARRDWVRWIESAKTPETRARRVRRTLEQLSEGKRRPCCVNVYEYMMRFIGEG